MKVICLLFASSLTCSYAQTYKQWAPSDWVSGSTLGNVNFDAAGTSVNISASLNGVGAVWRDGLPQYLQRPNDRDSTGLGLDANDPQYIADFGLQHESLDFNAINFGTGEETIEVSMSFTSVPENPFVLIFNDLDNGDEFIEIRAYDAFNNPLSPTGWVGRNRRLFSDRFARSPSLTLDGVNNIAYVRSQWGGNQHYDIKFIELDNWSVIDRIELVFGNTGADNNGGFTVSLAAVPEPSTSALFGVGALGLLLRRRK